MCGPIRLELPGVCAVTAECHRDVDTGVTMVRLYVGAGLVVTVTPEVADQIADAVIELAADQSVYVS